MQLVVIAMIREVNNVTPSTTALYRTIKVRGFCSIVLKTGTSVHELTM